MEGRVLLHLVKDLLAKVAIFLGDCLCLMAEPRCWPVFWRMHRKGLLFLLVGGSEALIGFVGLYLLGDRLGWPHDVAYFLVTVVAFEANFGLNFLITWKMPSCEFWPCLWKFHLAKGSLVFLAQGLFSLFTDVLGVNYLVVYVACLVPLTLVSFWLNNKGVFVVARRAVSS